MIIYTYVYIYICMYTVYVPKKDRFVSEKSFSAQRNHLYGISKVNRVWILLKLPIHFASDRLILAPEN